YLVNAVPGNSPALETLELTFNQDLNHDGVIGPPTTMTATQSIAVTIGGPGNDAFVFKPGFGTDVIANATTSDTIELDWFSSVTSINQLQTQLAEAQNGQAQSLFESANGGHDTVINLGNHDSIILANIQLAALHASNFIIH